MNIKNEDLENLKNLELLLFKCICKGGEIPTKEEFTIQYDMLYNLIEKLCKQQKEKNARTAKAIREKRKIDKNYARSKNK